MIELPTDENPVVIIHGDCLDILPQIPSGVVDAVVTSPPYNTLPDIKKQNSNLGLHGQRKSGVNKWVESAVKGYSDSLPENEYQEWQGKVVGDCLKLTKGLVWVNHKIRYRDGIALHPCRIYPFPIYAEVIWDRHKSMALNCKRYAPSHEGLWAFGCPHYWDDSDNMLMSVWRIEYDRNPNSHPCAFPVELASRPIRSSCPLGGIILDPFAGSGTTGVAAILEGRKAILIEKDAGYVEVIKKRIAETLGKPTTLANGKTVGRNLFESIR